MRKIFIVDAVLSSIRHDVSDDIAEEHDILFVATCQKVALLELLIIKCNQNH